MDKLDEVEDIEIDGSDIAEELPEISEEPVTSSTFLNASSSIKYAPKMPIVNGKYNLYGIVLVWTDNPGEDLGRASNATHATARVYKGLSNGALDFNVIMRRIHVNVAHKPGNLAAAEHQAKNSINNSGPHVYVMYNNGVRRFSSGGGDTAHLLGVLIRDVLHEVGHCQPTSLGHSGKYIDGKLHAYDDGTSFMGRFSSDKLTGAQLYLLGWLPEKKVAEYDIGDMPTDYNVESLYSDAVSDYVKVVLIPRQNARPVYLSMPSIKGKPVLAVHLSSGRGTQRVGVFGDTFTYEGLKFEKIANGTGFATVRVSTVS